MIEYKCQQSAIEQLKRSSEADNHSILIEGVSGCGKTYLATYFARTLKHIETFMIVEPTVAAIRDAVDHCAVLNSEIVLCIENLDQGVAGAAFTLLKLLEEPQPQTYVIVTCKSMHNLPDTIISRSVVIGVSPPVETDVIEYAQHLDPSRYMTLAKQPVWKSARTFKDVDMLFKQSVEHVEELNNIDAKLQLNEAVSTLVWNVGHYADGSETDIEYMVRVILNRYSNNKYVQKACIECLQELNKSRIAKHAVLAKLMFEIKYGG